MHVKKLATLLILLLIPLLGIFFISITNSYNNITFNINYYKMIALFTAILNLIVSLLIYILFDFSYNQFQFVHEYYNIKSFDIYLKALYA